MVKKSDDMDTENVKNYNLNRTIDTDGHEDNTKGGALCEEVLPSAQQ